MKQTVVGPARARTNGPGVSIALASIMAELAIAFPEGSRFPAAALDGSNHAN